MNKNVNHAPKIIQNTLKRRNHCIFNDFAYPPDCILMFFRSVLCYFGWLFGGVLAFIYSFYSLFMLFCVGFLHNIAQFMYILTFRTPVPIFTIIFCLHSTTHLLFFCVCPTKICIKAWACRDRQARLCSREIFGIDPGCISHSQKDVGFKIT